MVTEGFKKVIDHLNDGTDVSIVGPRGVGKSMALAAIATVCHGKIPCFLWSPYVTFNKDFQDYVENFYEELHRIKPSKCYSCGTFFFVLFLWTICNNGGLQCGSWWEVYRS